MSKTDTWSNDSNEWKSIKLCSKSYPRRVISILMCRNTRNATFLLSEVGNEYVLKFIPLTVDYSEKEIIEELNYLNFSEEQRKIAEPIRNKIIEGLVRKFCREK